MVTLLIQQQSINTFGLDSKKHIHNYFLPKFESYYAIFISSSSEISKVLRCFQDRFLKHQLKNVNGIV
jgi:hypothetical protein